MNGLVYSPDDTAESTPVYWLGVALAAAVMHLIPLYYLSFPKFTPEEDDVVMAVSLDDSFLDFDPTKPLVEPLPEAAKSAQKFAAAPALTPAPSKISAEPAGEAVDPPPTAKEQKSAAKSAEEAAKAAALLPVPPPPEAQAVAVKKAPEPKPPSAENKNAVQVDAHKPERKLHDIELPPLSESNETAFDESTVTTDKAPKRGFLSDRNSTAADRGPKNLKLGDPYVDKGDTNIIHYLNPRGEGDVAPLKSDANSGSVKKEGTLVEGDGGGAHAKDFSKNVKIVPDLQPAAEISPVPTPAAAPRKAVRPPVAVPITADPPRVVAAVSIQPRAVPSRPKPPEPDPIETEIGTRLAIPGKPDKKIEVPQPPLPVIEQKPLTPVAPPAIALDRLPPKMPAPDGSFRHPDGTLISEPDPLSNPAALNAPAVRAASRKRDPQAELDDFASQLNNVSTSEAAGDGTPGSGPKLRRGERGHEGNGAPRPGDSRSVSDVTTINLDSSAAEFGDPRFEKKFDAKTAYIKAFARRIDNKWKADIAARLRSRLIPGMVSIKIILRKDGKLLEASEAYRNRGVPDEYISTAKHAVEEAADPSADPFPPALADRESIEYTFNFLYQ